MSAQAMQSDQKKLDVRNKVRDDMPMQRLMRLATLLACGAVLWPAAATAQEIEFYHLDAIGNVRAITNQAGQIVERHDYLPFGEECVTGPCAGNPTVGAGQSRKFTGKERDEETGLDYFGARYYRANIGRFTTIDPVYTWRENLVDPQRWNRYAYARNNPLRYVDPDGRAIDVLVDVGSIIYDLFDIGRSVYRGEGVSGVQVGALGADVLGAAIPFATGGGAALRAAIKSERAAELVKSASKVSEMSAAERRAHYLEKGIGASDIGPSGYPKVHSVDHSTKKAAREAAEQRGKGEPMQHANPAETSQKPHYHGTDASGKKVLPNVHDNYPKSRR